MPYCACQQTDGSSEGCLIVAAVNCAEALLRSVSRKSVAHFRRPRTDGKSIKGGALVMTFLLYIHISILFSFLRDGARGQHVRRSRHPLQKSKHLSYIHFCARSLFVFLIFDDISPLVFLHWRFLNEASATTKKTHFSEGGKGIVDALVPQHRLPSCSHPLERILPASSNFISSFFFSLSPFSNVCDLFL